MIKVLDARFVTTAVKKEGYPRGLMREVAFVGRSNVGKSSMINALTNRKKLVRVSNTPGRTRTLNFFEVDLQRGETKLTLRLADLPGYGYAKVSKAEHASWEPMITDFLKERKDLRVIVSIIDAEIGPSEADLQMLEFLTSCPPKILVAATKIDRLAKAQRKPALHKLAATAGLAKEAVLGVSSTDRLGLDELWDALILAC